MTTNNIPLIINSFLPYGPLLRKANSFHEGLINIVEKEIKENNLEENLNNTFTKMKNDRLLALNETEIVKIEEDLQIIKDIKKIITPVQTTEEKKEKLKQIVLEQKKIEPSLFEVEKQSASKTKENYKFLISNIGNNIFSIKQDLISFSTETSLFDYLSLLKDKFNENGFNNLNLFFFDILEEKNELIFLLEELFFYWDILKNSNTICYDVFKEEVDSFKDNDELNVNHFDFLIEYELLFAPFNNLFKAQDPISFFNNLYLKIKNEEILNETDFITLVNNLEEISKIFNESLVSFTEAKDVDLILKDFLKKFKKEEKKEKSTSTQKKNKTVAKKLSYSFSFRKRYYLLSSLLKFLRDANGYSRYFLVSKGKIGSYNPVFVYNYLKEETLSESKLKITSEVLDVGNEFNFWELSLYNETVSNYQDSFDMTLYFLTFNDDQDVIPIDDQHKPLIDFYEEKEIKKWNEKKLTAFLFYRMEILSYFFQTYSYFYGYYCRTGESFEQDRLFKINFPLEEKPQNLFLSSKGVDFKLRQNLVDLDHTLTYMVPILNERDNWFFKTLSSFQLDYEKKVDLENIKASIKDLKVFQNIFFNFGISFLLESRREKNNFDIFFDEDLNSFSLPFISLNSYSCFESPNDKNYSILIYFLDNLIKTEIALNLPFEFFSIENHENLANWLFQDKITCASLISYEDFFDFFTLDYLNNDLEDVRYMTKSFLEKYWNLNNDSYCFVNLFKVKTNNETIKKQYEDLFKKLYFLEENRNSLEEEIKPTPTSTEESSFEDILHPEYSEGNYLYYQNTLDLQVDSNILEVVTYRKLQEDTLFIEINKGNYFVSQTRDEIFWEDSVYRQFETKISFWEANNIVNDDIVNNFPKSKGLIDFFKINSKKKKVTFTLEEFEIINGKRTWKQDSKTIVCSLVIVDGDFVLFEEEIPKSEQDLLVTEYKILLKEITDLFMSKTYNALLKSKIALIKAEKFKALLVEKDLKFLKIVETVLIGK